MASVCRSQGRIALHTPQSAPSREVQGPHRGASIGGHLSRETCLFVLASGMTLPSLATSSFMAARTSVVAAMRPNVMLLGLSASYPKSPVERQSYLIWEKGFAVRFAISAAVLSLAAIGAQHSTAAWLTGMSLQNRATSALQTLAHRSRAQRDPNSMIEHRATPPACHSLTDLPRVPTGWNGGPCLAFSRLLAAFSSSC